MEIMDIVLSGPKKYCYQYKVQKLVSVMVFGGYSWETCTFVKTPLMLNTFWSNICSLLDAVFFRDIHAYFNTTTPRNILPVLQQHGCIIRECGS